MSPSEAAKVTRGAATVPPGVARAVAIGNFDGVHRGHAKLISGAVAIARREGLESCVLTFAPHPARLLAPERAPRLLLPDARRHELIFELGVDRVVVQPFDAALAALSPHAFASSLLRDALSAKVVCVGYDFSFGQRRAGTIDTLTELGQTLGFRTSVTPAVRARGIVCASSAIRTLLSAGSIEEAAALLGRAPEVQGTVVHGAARGRTIGFPTVNLAVENEVIPCGGVYVGEAELPDGTRRRAAINIGTNPTFTGEGSPLRVEAHLLDHQGDLYGALVRLTFWARLRDERRFDGRDALIAQLHLDVEASRAAIRPVLPPTD